MEMKIRYNTNHIPTDGNAGPQSHPNEACIFLRKLTWHSPLYSLGVHSGGMGYEDEFLNSLAAMMGD